VPGGLGLRRDGEVMGYFRIGDRVRWGLVYDCVLCLPTAEDSVMGMAYPRYIRFHQNGIDPFIWCRDENGRIWGNYPARYTLTNRCAEVYRVSRG
jgi:hypothetical protein